MYSKQKAPQLLTGQYYEPHLPFCLFFPPFLLTVGLNTNWEVTGNLTILVMSCLDTNTHWFRMQNEIFKNLAFLSLLKSVKYYLKLIIKY